MKRNALIFLGLFIALITISQAQTKPETRVFQLSFIPQFGTSENAAGMVTNNLSINIFAGFNGGVQGIELGGFLNLDRNDVIGAQLAGFVNGIGGSVQGVQGAGFANYSSNVDGGVQLAGFTNITTNDVLGGQGSGFINYARNVKGTQLAGFANISATDVVGIQGAGFANYARKVKGVQAAGFINLATTVRGLQMSIINIADTVEKGATLGLINIVRKGMHKFELDYNDVSDINLSFKGGTPHLYSIISGGVKTGDFNYWTTGFGLGSQLDLGKKFYSGLEISTHSVQKKGEKFNDINILNKVQLSAGYYITPGISINAGPVLNIYRTDFKVGETQPIKLNQNPFYEKSTANRTVQMWIGYRVALRF